MRNGLLSLLAFLAAGGLLALLLRPEAPASRPTPPAARRAMPPLQMAALDGGSWRLPDHLGKVVLVNFWASWCPPCREETPGLIRLANEFRSQGLEVAGVSMDENPRDATRFAAQFHVPYPILLPGDNTVAAQIQSLPTTFLVDRQGRVANVFVGAVSEPTLQKSVRSLLAE